MKKKNSCACSTCGYAPKKLKNLNGVIPETFPR